MKTCRKCLEEKGEQEFASAKRNKDGLHSYCKACMKVLYSGRDRSDYKRDYDKKNAEYIRSYKRAYRKKKAGDLWEDRNPDRVREIKERYKESNPEKVRASSQKYREANPHKYAAYASKRRFVSKRAEPNWLTPEDKAKIELMWGLRDLKSLVTGIDHEVDHVVPLNGKTVCGLHVPWNLQVIPKTENRKKQARVWPDMWEGL